MLETTTWQCFLSILAIGAVLSGCATLDTQSPAQNRQTGEPAKEAEEYRTAIRARPEEAALPWFLLGNLYAEQGRLAQAEHAYRESLKYGEQAKVLHNLGLVQIRQGLEALQKARRQLPPTDPIHRQTRQYLKALLESGL